MRLALPGSMLSSSAAAAGGLEYRHSRRVALLRRLLPVIGLSLLLLIATWPRLAPLWERMRTGFPAIDLSDAQELRMINPRYAGIDRHGHPFVVTAAIGRQVPQHQDLMSLQKPRAQLRTNNGAEIFVSARTGIYQQQTQLLDLFTQVTLTHQNGTEFITNRARVNGANETAEGNDPIAGHGPSGAIKAQGFRVLDKGDRILFTGKSDALLRSARLGNTPAAAPAALPAPVAQAAAEVAAVAAPLLAADARRQRAKPVRVRAVQATHTRGRTRAHPAHARHLARPAVRRR